MRYKLSNEHLTITVATRGAELVHVLCDGKERLWQNEDGSWRGHAPVLFPVCGHCGMTVEGKDYPLSAHGFAKKSEFTLFSRSESHLCFRLDSSEATARVYPFAFRFLVRYELHGRALKVTYEVQNPQDKPLYFSCGGHESYALERTLADYKLVFPAPVQLTHLFHDEGGYLTGETLDFGMRRELPLPEELLQDGNTLILKNLAVREATLCTKEGERVASLAFPDFANLLLWRPGNAKMICIEPWGNLPDAVGERKEFAQKAGVVCVAPHETKSLTHTIEY